MIDYNPLKTIVSEVRWVDKSIDPSLLNITPSAFPLLVLTTCPKLVVQIKLIYKGPVFTLLIDFFNPEEKKKIELWLAEIDRRFLGKNLMIVNALDLDESLKRSGANLFLEHPISSLHFFFYHLLLNTSMKGNLFHWSHTQNLLKGVGRGLLLSLQQETDRFRCHSIESDEWESDSLIEKAFNESVATAIQVRYSAGQRQILKIGSPLETNLTFSLIQNRGIYLIAGGNGKIGQLLATYLIQKYQATVVILGRRKINIVERQRLVTIGVKAYVQMDIGNLSHLKKCWSNLEKSFTHINGIFHLSGLIEDQLLKNKEWESFKRVIIPKMEGTYNLDFVSKEHNLDFFVGFSSLTALIGNIGQTDYAAANAFLDDYMIYRNQLAQEGQRKGKSFSINWGLWEEGGMNFDYSSSDLSPMNTLDTLRGLESVLLSESRQIIISKGGYKKLIDGQEIDKKKQPNSTPPTKIKKAEPSLVQRWISERLFQFTKIRNLDKDESLVKLGMDSISIVNVLKALEKDLKSHDPSISVSKTLIFDHQTLDQLTTYFMATYASALSKKFPLQDEMPIRISEKSPSVFTKIKQENKNEEGIAVIGVAGRFPQAENLEIFWQHLSTGKNCITVIPQERWDWRQDYSTDPDQPGKTYGRHGGFLSSIKEFDPLFFGISPIEAKRMDPQERLLLETVYHSLEDASLESIPQRTAVYIAAMFGHYKDFDLPNEVIDTSFAAFSNRLSYYFNFHGPSITLDTMCSGSLTGLHLAIHSLRKDECELAIVGGVNLMPHPVKYRLLSQGKFLSKKGKCHPFGREADGYVPGEGIISLVLKKQNQALKDRDKIYGTIKGSSINSGGRTSGFTVPSMTAQKEVVMQALKNANVEASTISYVEAHGTGTELGDPIEIEGLKEAYQLDTTNSCALGSVKSNIGHLESASGLAGIVKTLLQFKYRTLVPTINCKFENPHLHLDKTPFYLIKNIQEWTTPIHVPRRAGVSSFGAGGSNTHLIVEEAPDLPPFQTPHLDLYLLFLSGNTQEALERQKKELLNWINNHRIDLYALVYTLGCCRKHMKYRQAFIGSSLEEIKKELTLPKELKELELPSFSADELLSHFAQSNTKKDHYAQIIKQHYEQGMSFDFKKLYPLRLLASTPLYCFEKEEYWNEHFLTPILPKESKKELPAIDTKRFFSFIPKWEKKEMPQVEKIDSLLIVLDEGSDMGNHFIKHNETQCYSFEDLEKLFLSIQEENTTKYPKDSSLSIACFLLFSLLEVRPEKLEESMQAIRMKFFSLGQRLMNCKISVQFLCFYPLVSIFPLESFLRSLGGFLKILPLENQRIQTRFVEIDSKNPPTYQSLMKEIKSPQTENYIEVLLRTERFEKRFSTTFFSFTEKSSSSHPIKQNGVFLIPGGLGHIGKVIARYLLQNFKARVILIGRSFLDTLKKKELEELKKLGGKVEYIQADLTIYNEAEAVIKQVLTFYSIINGIIYSAGQIKDRLLKEKNFEEFEQVFSTKYHGVINLDKATKTLKLDFFVLFSSIASIFGNVGQTDYAMGNAFLDAFAECRNQLCYKKNHRSGHTLSLNWPLWTEGSAKLDPLQKQFMREEYGLEDISDEEGIQIFENALVSAIAHKRDQVIVTKGDIEKMRAILLPKKKINFPSINQFNKEALELHSTHFLIETVGKLLDISIEKIEKNQILGDFGFNSVYLQKFAQAINEKYKSKLAPSAFFTYNTIEKISKFLIEKYREALLNIHQVEQIEPLSEKKPIIEASLLALNPRSFTPPAYAIIGMQGLMPGAESLDQFWENQLNGHIVIRSVKDRWPNRDYFCGLIDGMDHFDPKFFGMSAREAMLMDPQHRLFLEVGFNTFIDAGYNPHKLFEVGVFVGVQFNDYQILLQQWKQSRHPYAATGNAHALLANRFSYYFDFHGPSQTIDTACSSSLVALKRGINSLEQGECKMALVGATSLLIDHEVTDAAKSMGVLSPYSRCATFDKDADGYVRGEGVGCILIKRLEDAQKDGDHCYGIVRTVAENHGGRAHSLTAPNPEAQKRLLLSAYRNFSPHSVSYIEAHGTGTKLGDPIEIDALKAAWNEMEIQLPSNTIPIGSVKTHIGHLEPAAGIASLLKVLLSLKHKMLPHNLHFKRLNPYISLEDSPFYILTENQPWEPIGKTRIAGISSFGFGGSNTHAVIEESTRYFLSPSKTQKEGYFIPLSARSQWSYRKWTKDLYTFLKKPNVQQDSYYSLENLAYTLSIGRPHYEYRGGCVVENWEQLFSFLNEHFQNNPLFVELKKDKSLLFIPEDLKSIKKLSLILNYYLEGSNVDWEKLYPQPLQRLSLPLYPFENHAFWFEEAADLNLAELS